MDSAFMALECRWGVIPGQAEDSKKWFYTREQLGSAGSLDELFKEAFEFHRAKLDPLSWNWVELTWIYF